MTLRTEENRPAFVDFMSSLVVVVSSETNFIDEMRLMVGKQIGNIVVADDEKVVGIVTKVIAAMVTVRDCLQHSREDVNGSR